MALNLTDILDRHGVSYRVSGQHHHVTRNFAGVDCPKCSPGSGKYRLGFQLDGRRANCWVCGRLDAVEMLATVCGISTGEAIRLWRQRGFDYQAEDRVQGQLKIPAGVGELQIAHRRYLLQRGFDPDQIEQLWGVKGIGIAAKLSWRLYIPIFSKDGKQVSWTTRSLNPTAELRYVSASAEEELIPHKSILYGAHLSRTAVIVTEGPTDAWAIGPGAVATCGVGCTQAQIAEIADYPVRYTCFDAEPDAQRRADSVCEQLTMFPGLTENLVLETGNDPASADPAEIADIRSRFLE